MPTTKKGSHILRAMKKEYGDKKGTSVFFSAINKGRLLGTHKKNSVWERRAIKGRKLRGKAVFKNSLAPKKNKTRRHLTKTHKAKISRALQGKRRTIR